MDARVKLAALVALGIASLRADSVGMVIATGLAFFVLLQVRIPIRQAVFELRWFMALVLIVGLIRCMNTPGQAIVAWHGIALSRHEADIEPADKAVVCLGRCESAADIAPVDRTGQSDAYAKQDAGLDLGSRKRLLNNCRQFIGKG